jgi:DNA-binding NarL/FixJ family response regulator
VKTTKISIDDITSAGYSSPGITYEKERGLLSEIRILVVDDNEDWRRKVRELVQKRPGLQVICEVSDGIEAVEKAGELKPDLIVLDIGLPRLNGIEAARQIRQISPSSKIVFLSVDSSLEVMQEALSTGASDYIHKARAQSDLLPAIDAALQALIFLAVNTAQCICAYDIYTAMNR